MKNVKAQLRSFYARQGLTGKHRRKAMQHDMKAARRNAWHDIGATKLGCAFIFINTPEGSDYWYKRAADQYDENEAFF